MEEEATKQGFRRFISRSKGAVEGTDELVQKLCEAETERHLDVTAGVVVSSCVPKRDLTPQTILCVFFGQVKF